jgi:hypothetical protein
VKHSQAPEKTMKKMLIIALFAVPALGVLGCQQDPSLQSDVASLKSSVASLQDENKRLREDLSGLPRGENGEPADVGTLLARLERQERELADARRRLAELEGKPVVAVPSGEPVLEGEVAIDDGEYAKFKAMAEKDRAERDAIRAAERERRQAEQTAEAKRLAEKYGFEFDEKDPRGSIMKIMSDPVQRAKAIEAMRTEMADRRLEPLKLDDYQKKEVLRIEEDTRSKVRDAMANARENGATQEEIEQQVKTIQEEQKTQLGSVLTPEQMEEYEKSGAQMGGMIPGMGGGAGGWGGMIPGFGGGNGR